MKLQPNTVKFLIAIIAGLLSWVGAMFSLPGVYAAGPVLTRYPFIAKQTATATIIIWHTDVATTSQLDYGPTLS